MLSVDEDGSGTYTVKLNTLPSGSVTITPSSGDAGAATVSPATLTFTTSNWDTAKTVTVSGVDDGDANNESVTVSHGVSGYGTVTTADGVTVTVTDTDTAGVTVDDTTLSVNEGGSGTYTVVLDTQPGGNVTVTPSSGDVMAATVSPATLTFTMSNWDTAKTVTVSGVDDNDTNNESVTVSHAVSGYTGVTVAPSVTVTVTDNNTTNSEATGAPSFSVPNVYVVPAVLTANLGGIADTDGKTNIAASATYQWLRTDSGVDSEISGATGSTYALTPADAGKQVKVRVRFTDDQGNAEGPLTSTASPTVGAAAACPAPTLTGGAALIGSGRKLTVAADGLGRFGFSTGAYGSLDDTTFTTPGANDYTFVDIVTGNSVDSNVFLRITPLLSAADKRRLTLHICDTALPFGPATEVGGIYTMPSSPGLGFVPHAERTIYISRDAAAPTFTSAAVSGATLRLLFSEDLDTGSVPAATDFTVKVGGTAVGLAASDAVAVADNTVTLTLANAVTVGQTVTVSYVKPGSNALKDAIGNETADFTDAPVTNNTANGEATGAPSFSVPNVYVVPAVLTANLGGIADAGGVTNIAASATYQWLRTDGGVDSEISGATGSTYALTPADAGKQVKVRVRFTDDQGNAEGPLTSTASPTVGAAAACPAPTLTGGAALIESGRKVTLGGNRRGVGYFAGSYGSLDDTTFKAGGNDYEISRFAMFRGSNVLAFALDSGLPSAERRRLTLHVCAAAFPVASASPTNASYQSMEWNAPSLAWQGEAERTIYISRDAAAPTFTSAAVGGATLRLLFSEDLDTGSVPDGGVFTVTVDGTAVNLASTGAVAVAGNAVTLTLAAAVTSGQAVTVAYTKPSSGNVIRDPAHNETASFTAQMASADTAAPAFVSAVADGTSLVVTFDEPLAAAARLAGGDFGVKRTPAGGSETAAGLSATVAPVIGGRTVTLTLAAALLSTDTSVKVSYTKPTTDSANRLEDAFGNETATFTDQPVTNATPNSDATGAPAVTVPDVYRVPAVLGVDLSGIADADGKTNIASNATYQWLRVDADGTSNETVIVGMTGAETGATYTLTAADAGKRVKVRVNFTDDAGRVEGPLTSAAVPPSGTVTAAAACPAPTLAGGTALIGPGRTVRMGKAGNLVGYSGSSTPHYGSLDNAAFGIGGNDYTLDSVTTSTITFFVGLDTALSPAVRAGLILHVCATPFPFASATVATGSLYQWDLSGIDWRDEVARTVYLSGDAVAPALGAPAVDGATLTLPFGEDLDTGSVPAATDFTVKVGGTAVGLAASDAVAVADNTVTLTLANAVTAGQTVTVSYVKPGSNALKDAIGNETADFTDAPVTNNTVNGEATGAPSVSVPNVYVVPAVLTANLGGIADAGGVTNIAASATYQWLRTDGATDSEISGATGSTYALTPADAGKQVKVRVSFTDDQGNAEGPLTSTASPTVGAAAACPAPTLTGGAALIGSGRKLTLGGNDRGIGYIAGLYGSVDDTTFSAGGNDYEILSFAMGRGVNNLAFGLDSGLPAAERRRLTLHVCAAAFPVASARPTIASYQSMDWNAPSLVWKGEAERTIYVSRDAAAPTFTSAAVSGATLRLLFSEDLDTGSVPDGGVFTVTVGGTAVNLVSTGAVAVAGNAVTLTLAAAVTSGQAVTVAYTKPSSGNVIRDPAHNETASFTAQMAPADTAAPAFVSAVADGTSLVVTFDEPLAAAASLANGDFGVKRTPAGGSETAAGLSATVAPVIGGRTVTLTLAAALLSTDTGVKVSYTKPTTDSANRLEDAFGNETATFTDQPVTNATPNSEATGAPSVTVPNVYRVPALLGVDLSGILDTDGVTNIAASATYQWLRVDADGTSNETPIAGATSATYTLTAADVGKKLKVRLNFTDDANNAEGPLTSAAVPSGSRTVTAVATCAAPTYTGGAVEIWKATLTVGGDGQVSSDGTYSTRGFSSAGVDKDKFGALDDATFEVDGQSHTISHLINGDDLGTIDLRINPALAATAEARRALAAELVLHVCETPLALLAVASEYNNGRNYEWTDHGIDWSHHVERTVSLSRDAVAPTLGAPAVDGATLTLPFGENLDTGSVPAATDFTVKVGGTEVNLAASGAVAVAGDTVTLTLANAVTIGQTVTVSYVKPSSGNVIRDAAHNEAADFTDAPVTNNTANGEATGAPSFSVPNVYVVPAVLTANLGGIADTGGVTNIAAGATYQWLRTDGGVDREISGATGSTYALTPADAGKQVKVRVRFTDDQGNAEGPLTSTASPTVAAAAACPAPTLTGGAALIGSGRKLTVGGDPRGIGYIAGSYGSVDDTTFSAGGNDYEILTVAMFWGTDILVFGLDSGLPSAERRRLTLHVCAAAFPVASATPRNASYQSMQWNDPSLVWQGEAERTIYVSRDAAAPTFTSAAVSGATLRLLFSENLDTGSIPDGGVFTVTVGGTAVNLAATGAVAVAGNAVTLTLAAAPTSGQAVTVAYTKPSSGNVIRDPAHNETASFTAQMAPADTAAPAFVSAVADGTSLVVTFDEPLAAAASLANGDFGVKRTPAGGSETAAGLSTTVAPVIGGRTVTLTLAAALLSTDTGVKVSYTKPTTDSANRLEDTFGNETATFTDQPVTNATAADLAIAIAAARPTATGKVDSITWTLTREGPTTAAATVPVTLAPFTGNDWELPASSLSHSVTIPIGSATGTLTVSLQPMALAATMSGNLTASLGAVAGYDTSDTDAVRVLALAAPVWTIRVAETYRFTEDGGAQTVRVEAVAASAEMPAPTVDMLFGFENHGGTATEGVDFRKIGERKTIERASFAAGADGKQVGYVEFDLTIIDDDLVEPEETLTMSFSAWGGQPAAIGFQGERHGAFIVDDDAGLLSVAVTSVPALTSTGAAAPDTYGVGERIEFTATFNRAVTVTGAPTFEFALEGGSRRAAYARGSGTAELVFVYTVRAADTDPNGIDWAANRLLKPGGAAIGEAGGTTAAPLDHAAQIRLPGHRVDGAMNAAPVFVSARASGAALTMTFNKTLAAAANLTNSAFTVRKTPVGGGAEETVTLGSAAPSVDGATVALTLAAALAPGDTGVKVSYAKPATGSANRIEDGDGNETASFTDEPVTNATPGVFVSTAALTVTEGATDTYTVHLATRPSGAVTVTPTSADIGAAAVFPAALTFTAANWSRPRTVTVTGATDADTANESVTVSHAVSGGGYGMVAAPSVTVTVTDDDTANVLVSPTALTVDEGGTGTYTVKLATDPGSNVTVTLTSGDPGAAVVSPAALTFTTGNWSRNQTVTVSGEDDIDTDDESVTVTHAVSGYTGVTAVAPVTVTVTDNDTADTTAPALSSAAVNAAVLTLTFDEALDTNSVPAASAFTVNVDGSDVNLFMTDPVTVSGSTVTLNLENGVPPGATVKVSYAKPSSNPLQDTAGNETANFTDEDVTNNTPGIIVSPAALTVVEKATNTYTVKLAIEPTGDVIVSPISGDTGAATVTGALTFTTGNWNTAQTVTVSGKEDIDTDNETVTVTHVLNSTGNYAALGTQPSVTVTVTDTDSANSAATGKPAISGKARVGQTLTADVGTIADTDGLPTTFPDDYTLQWTREDSDGSNKADISGATSGTYTPVAADVGKKIRVKASFSDDASNSEGPLTSDAWPGTGTVKAAVTVSSVAVTSTPAAASDTYGLNEKIRFTVTFSEAVNMSTGANQPHFEFSLGPSGGGVVKEAAYESGSGGTALVFAYTVQASDMDPNGIWIGDQDDTLDLDTGEYIRAVSDGADAVLTHSQLSTQTGHKVDGSLAAAGVVVSPTTLTVDEGSTNTYTVKLATDPGADVTVTPTSADTGAMSVSPAAPVSVSPAALTFTTGNWNTAQTVTVSGEDDTDTDNETVTVSHTVSGYTGVTAVASVTVTVTDDDNVVIGFGETDISVNEGAGTATVEVRLLKGTLTQDITLTAATADGTATQPGDYTANTTTVNFSSGATVGAKQTVTIAIADDSVVESDETFTVNLSGASLPDDIVLRPDEATVTITDNDGLTLGFNPNRVNVDEDAGTVTLNIEVFTGTLSPTVTLPVNINTMDGSATAADGDYTAVVNQSVTFANGATVGDTRSVTLSITNDSIAEFFPTEIFFVNASVGNVNPRAKVDVTVPQATISIIDDEVAIGFDPTSVSVNESAGTATVDVKVRNNTLSQAVTLTATTADGTATQPADYTANTTTVNFSSGATVGAKQTVTIAIIDDNVVESDEWFTVNLTGSSLPADVALFGAEAIVTITESAAVLVSPTALTVDEGSSGTYTVTLATLPTGNVTVTPTSGDTGAATLSPTAALTFTTGNWNTAQTVTVSGEDDIDTDDESVTVTHAVTGYTGVTAVDSVTVTVTDDDSANSAATGKPAISGKARVGETLTAAVGTIADTDGLPTTTFPTGYTLQWTREDADGMNKADISGATSGTYTPVAADVGKKIRVEASFTDDASNSEGPLTSDAWPAGTGTVKAAVTVSSIAVTSTPAATSDTYGVGEKIRFTVTFSEEVNVSAGRPHFNFALGPSGNPVTTPAPYESGTGSTALVFAYTVLAGDSDPNGIWIRSSSENTLALETGEYIRAVSDAADAVINFADQGGQTGHKVDGSLAVGVVVDPTTLTVVEEATGGTYTVKLGTQPSAGVTVTPTSGDTGAATLSPAALTFTTSNWSTAQTITVTGVMDTDTNDETVTVTHAVTSTDSDYAALPAPSVTVTVTDDDSANSAATGKPTISGKARVGETLTAAVGTIADTDGLPTTFPDDYTIQWTREDSDGSNKADISGATSGTYTPVAADVGKKIRVKASFSDDASNSEGPLASDALPTTGTVKAAVTVSSVAVTSTPAAASGTYGLGEKIRFTVTFSEEVNVSTGANQPHFEFSLGPSGGGVVKEAVYESGSGGTALVFAYTVLAGDSDDNGIWIGDQSRTLKLGTGEYIRAVSDAADAVLTHSPPSTQANHKVNGSLALGVVVDPTTLTVAEGGNGTYTVKLGTQPSASVTVTPGLSTADATKATLSPTTALTFTTSTWNTAQTVTVSGDQDTGANDETVTVTHVVSSTDSDYAALPAPSVTVTVDDDENANNVATGKPTISGKARVGQTLTAAVGTIADTDGLPTTFPDDYTIQWTREDSDGSNKADISGATSGTYTPVAADVGKKIRVKASFTDDASNSEGPLASDALPTTGTVKAAVTVSSVAVTSTPAATSDTYGVGEKIRFTVTFSELVTSSASPNEPHFNFALGPLGGEVDTAAAYESGSGGTALVFAYTVLASDMDPNGIWIGDQDDTLDLDSGEYIRAVSDGADAVLTHSQEGTQTGHKVDGSLALGVVVSTTALTVVEEATGGTYTVKLGTQPSAGVTVTPTSGDTGAATLSPAALTFTTSNWSTAQTITVTGVMDTDTNDETVTVSHAVTSTDSDYAALPAPSVTVTVTDNDSANALPTSTNNTVTIAEDATKTFAASDFAFTDTDAGDALASVKVTTLPTAGTLSLDGTAIAGTALPKTVTKAELDSDDLVFTPAANAHGDPYGTFMFKVNDGTADSTTAYTMTVDVTPVNDAPIVVNGIPNQTATAGTTFSYAFPANTFNDVDGDTLSYTAVEDGETSLPTWLTFTASTRSFSGTPANTDAGTLTVKVTANDSNSGSVADTFNIVVSAANALPTSTNNTVTIAEDATKTFAASDFAFTDTDAGDALASVKITTLPTAGALSFDGTAIAGTALPKTVTKAELDSDDLVFTPAANAHGDPYGTFMFKVNDGTADSTTAYTMTVDVTPVNDAPIVVNGIPNQTATAGTTFSYAFPANTFNDVDGDTLSYTAVEDGETSLPTWLTFTASTRSFSGTPANTDAGTLTVKVTANDSNSGSVADTFNIVVSAANALPTSTNNTVTIAEDATKTFAASDFAFTDTDAGDALASVKITTLPTAGTLSLDGTAIAGTVLPKTVTKAELDSDDLVFTPAANAHGDPYGTFMFKVNDGTADSTAAYRMTIDVTPVNDAPIVVNGIPNQTATAGTTFSYTVPMNTFNDVDGDTLSYTAVEDGETSLPTWLTFTASTRSFSGTPADTDVGTLTVKVTANDSNSGSVADTFNIVVSATPTPVTDPPDTTPTPDADPPGAPQMNTPTVEGTAGVVSWRAPSDDGGSPVLRYQYRVSISGYPHNRDWIDLGEGVLRFERSSHSDVEYFYQVRAVNSAGPGPAISGSFRPFRQRAEALSALTPGSVHNLVATPGDRRVRLSWEAPTTVGEPQVTRYEYRYVRGNIIWLEESNPDWQSAGTGRSATITELVNRKDYIFEVRAVNRNGAGNQVLVRTAPHVLVVAPPAVTGLRLEVEEISDIFGLNGGNRPRIVVRWNRPTAPWDTYPYLGQFQARITAAGRAPSQWYDVGDAWVGNAWSDAAAITRFEDDGAFDRLEYGVQYTVEMRAVARAATFVSQNSGWEFIGTDIPGAIATPVHVTAEAPELPELEVFTEGTATEGQPLTVGLRRPDNTTDHPNHLGSELNAMVMIRDVNTLEVQETVWVKVASGAREGTTNRWTAPYDGQAADRQLEIRLVHWQPGRNYVNGTPAGLRVTLTNAEALQRVGPSVTAVAISPAPGGDAWDAGETVEAVLTFDEAVTVDTTNGTPHVQFELGTDTTRKDAGYASGSGTTALTFRHTVPTGQGPHRMALLAIDSLALNGGTIRSTATGANADLAHRGAAYAGVITQSASTRSASSGPTAQFSALPASHDGANTFEAELTFSGDPDGLNYVTVRNSLLEVTNGAVENAQRKTRGSDIGWVLTVRPSGRGSVTLTLPSRACGTEGAVCIGGEPLASDATATVPGPATVSTTPVSTTPALPTISIAAPAQTPVTEGAALSFTLTRTGATDEALTVAVAVTETGNVLNATPPASVTFAQGSATATLNVGTVDDTTVEEASTVTVRVSDGSGYTVAASGDTASGVVASEDLAPITAQFTQAQDEHDGGAFELQFTFSHAPLLNYVTVRDALFDVTGGRIEYVRRLTWGNNLAWELRVKPDGFGDVTLTARATTDCEAAHGVCDAAGRKFDGALERTIQGPPTLSVADAEVEEAEGATLEFTVTLSRSLDEAVTVTYATADGTATAGSDYRAANDTLTFTAGETAKTVSVAVLYNTHDEGSETLTLTLTSPSPSTVKLADADATGTITNTGPLPAAWTARFGRTVAEQVLDAVEGRMEAGRTAGLEVILAGEPITWQTEAAEGSLAPTGEDVFNDVVGRMGRRVHSGSLTSENVLSGSSFTLTRKNCKNCENGGGHSDKGLLALWGHGAVSSFDGQEDKDDLSLTGDVSSAMVGADWGGERVLAGLVVGHSSGNGSYSATGGNGVISSSLTGLYPWARYELNEQLEVWGAAGYGAGSLTLTPDGENAMDADLSLWMGAAGLRGLLIDGGAEGFTLAATTDALAVTTTTAAVAGEMAATDGGVTRLRLGLEGSLPVQLSDASLLTTSIEMGLRHDDGDAETGFGLEMGAGLAWHHQKRGLRAELRGRGLLTHAAEGFSNRGLSLSLAWDPTPASALGASFSLSQSMGGAATGGVDALLSPITMAGLTNTNGDGGSEMENQRLELRLGYGLPAFSHAFSLTPELVVGLSETERDYSLLLALAPLGQDGSMDVSLDLTGKQSTSSSSNGAGAIEHSLDLRFTLEF